MLINRTTLPNGLRLVHQQDTTTQMVTVNTLYRVGSRDEAPRHTGFAHLFEHLMFGGTPLVPDFDALLEQACGENNAYTTTDYTNYYITLPLQNIETALWLESDRMAGLAFSPESLEVQRKVVMEEFKLHYINQPYGDLYHLIAAMSYPPGHPYSWPTIGLQLSHIADATMQQVKDFFHRYYRPSNAILSIVGDITWEETQRLVLKWYGTDSPPAPPCEEGEHIDHPDEVTTPLPHREWQGGGAVPASLLVLTFLIPPRTDPMFPACDMLTDILASGRSSRLHSSLVDHQHLLLEADASVSGRLGEGLLVIECVLPDDTTFDAAEQALWQQLDSLCQEPVGENELQKVKNRYEANFHMEMSDPRERAAQLAYYEMLGDACLINTDVSQYRAVTADRLLHTARQILTREHAHTLRYEKNNNNCNC